MTRVGVGAPAGLQREQDVLGRRGVPINVVSCHQAAYYVPKMDNG